MNNINRRFELKYFMLPKKAKPTTEKQNAYEWFSCYPIRFKSARPLLFKSLFNSRMIRYSLFYMHKKLHLWQVVLGYIYLNSNFQFFKYIGRHSDSYTLFFPSVWGSLNRLLFILLQHFRQLCFDPY
jgi:hypothetical protein